MLHFKCKRYWSVLTLLFRPFKYQKALTMRRRLYHAVEFWPALQKFPESPWIITLCTCSAWAGNLTWYYRIRKAIYQVNFSLVAKWIQQWLVSHCELRYTMNHSLWQSHNEIKLIVVITITVSKLTSFILTKSPLADDFNTLNETKSNHNYIGQLWETKSI